MHFEDDVNPEGVLLIVRIGNGKLQVARHEVRLDHLAARDGLPAALRSAIGVRSRIEGMAIPGHAFRELSHYFLEQLAFNLELAEQGVGEGERVGERQGSHAVHNRLHKIGHLHALDARDRIVEIRVADDPRAASAWMPLVCADMDVP